MMYTFDRNTEKKLGNDTAAVTLFHHIACRVQEHEVDENGISYTYNSVAGLMNAMPFFTKEQLTEGLKKLIKCNLVLVDKYKNMNRYTLTVKGWAAAKGWESF